MMMMRSLTHGCCEHNSSSHELSGLIEKQLLEGINVHNGTCVLCVSFGF